MTSQLPPPPEGRITGFPYSLLWEEFAQIWEGLAQKRDTGATYEALLATAAPLQCCLPREPSREAIRDTIKPLGLPPAAAQQLCAELYRIASAYRIPQLKKELGLGAGASKKHLARLADASAKLVEMLESTTLEQEVVLGQLRRHVDPKAEKPLFNFKELVKELNSLGATAKMMADEIPQMPRGTSVNILRARLMEAATRAIGQASADFLEVVQTDSTGRKPRPKSTSAHVLFAYLNLVDPSMTNKTMVRLFLDHNCGPRRVSMEELKALPPKRWRHHAAHKRLTR